MQHDTVVRIFVSVYKLTASLSGVAMHRALEVATLSDRLHINSFLDLQSFTPHSSYSPELF